MTTLLPVSESPAQSNQFLRLRLVPDTPALLPVQHLTEVLTIPVNQIVPIPHMPAWVMGVYNWRGEILWMVDLAHLGGLTPWYQQPRSVHATVVLRMRGADNRTKPQTLGLIVHQVEDMEWINPDQMQPLTVPPEAMPFVQGYCWTAEGTRLTVLDGAAIVRLMPR